MRVVADDEVDLLLSRCKVAPILDLPIVGNDAAFEPVMDREDAVVGGERNELVHHGLEIGTVAVRRLAGAVAGCPKATVVAGDDADCAEADAGAAEIEAGRVDRLLESAADTGKGDRMLGVGDGEVIERLLDSGRAVIRGVVIGKREQIEAETDEGLHRRRVTPEVECGVLVAGPFPLRLQVVSVGDDGLDIDEGKIAVDVFGDAGGHVGEGRDLPFPAPALGIDLGIARIEAGIAHEHDGHAVEARA